MTSKLFSELGLSPEIIKAVDRLGFEQASPIQSESIPLLMQGRDIVGQSQTGSGKTAAFGIPAIEKIDLNVRGVQVLVLCPTRELAVQVCEEIHKLAFFKRGIHALPIYGGQSYDRQFYGLKQGAQIVIGTPGRIMDHMRRGTLRLDKIKLAVLDEADVMLNMGFREDIEFILQAVPAERQTVFFSATMPRPILDLIQRFAREPQSLRIEQKTMTVATTEQSYYEVDRRSKIELLTRLIDIYDINLGIIFCNTKRMVDDLVDHLNMQGYSADRLHGDMTQNMRDRVMNKFRKTGLEFLVATDIAARGIDVDDVQVVFNYDLPYDVEDYVHRIGRTGRAGRSGRAISFVSRNEVFQIRNIERFTNTRIERAKMPTENEVEEARANSFVSKVRTVLQGKEFNLQERLVERLLEEGYNSADVISALIHLLQEGEGAATHAEHQDDRNDDRRDYRDSRYSSEPRRFERQDRGDFEPRHYDKPERPRPAAPKPALAPVAKKIKPAVETAPLTTPSATPVAVPQTKPEPIAPLASAPAPAIPQTAEPLPQTAPSTVAQVPAIKPMLKPKEAKPAKLDAGAKVKASRRTPEGQTRIYINQGVESGATAPDLVNTISGETGLPAKVVGFIDLRERHSFIDVLSEHANAIISKLNRARFKNQKIKAKIV
jgi:ATP-dependent RNA helicase DeaD